MEKNKESVNTPRTAHKKDISRVLRLCVIYLLVVSLIVVPVTFSKYVSTVEGHYTGAEFAGIDYNINYISQGYSLTLEDNNSSHEFYYKKVYICASEFSIDNAQSDVSYDYKLSLSLVNSEDQSTLNYASLLCPFTKEAGAAPSKSAQIITVEDNTTIVTPLVANYSLNFTENSVYYYLNEERHETKLSDSGTLDLVGRFNVGDTEPHTYSILVFIDLTKLGKLLPDFKMENYEISYTITCSQID